MLINIHLASDTYLLLWWEHLNLISDFEMYRNVLVSITVTVFCRTLQRGKKILLFWSKKHSSVPFECDLPIFSSTPQPLNLPYHHPLPASVDFIALHLTGVCDPVTETVFQFSSYHKWKDCPFPEGSLVFSWAHILHFHALTFCWWTCRLIP